jgi:5-methylcytosine-specific restriction protein A
MPTRPRTPCSSPGCSGRVDTGSGGRCERCRQGGVYERKPVAAAAGYDRVWSARRLDYLGRHPWCVLCPAAATVPDHYPDSRRALIAAGVGDPDADHRLRPLCASCHNKSTAQRQPGGWHRLYQQ